MISFEQGVQIQVLGIGDWVVGSGGWMLVPEIKSILF